MSNLELGIVVFVAMMVAIALRMPIAIALVRRRNSSALRQSPASQPLLGLLNDAAYSRVATHSLTVIPLFILMGQFAAQGGISQALYRSARAWVGHFRGGLAIATIGGCAAFGAICGSSVATGATMATIAMPEMRRYGYSGALATGSLGRRRHPRNPDPAVHHSCHLCHPDRAVAGASVCRGHHSRRDRSRRLCRRDRGLCPDQPGRRPRRRARKLAGPPPQPAGGLAGRDNFYRCDRRHLSGVFTPTEGAAVGAAATGVLSWTAGDMRWEASRRRCSIPRGSPE